MEVKVSFLLNPRTKIIVFWHRCYYPHYILRRLTTGFDLDSNNCLLAFKTLFFGIDGYSLHSSKRNNMQGLGEGSWISFNFPKIICIFKVASWWFIPLITFISALRSSLPLHWHRSQSFASKPLAIIRIDLWNAYTNWFMLYTLFNRGWGGGHLDRN